MLDRDSLPSWQLRLADELADDGIDLGDDDEFVRLVLDELDHCRRAPVFEGRRPTYGAMIIPTGGPRIEPDALNDRVPFDLVPLTGDPVAARSYADGRASYLVRRADGTAGLACFERGLLFETDVVRLQELTGAAIVQRTPVLDVVRLAVDGAMISWDGRNWQVRPTATTLLEPLLAGAPELGDELAAKVLELAVHWLAPSRVGTTIVIHHGPLDMTALDVGTAVHTPPLSVGNRRHFSALLAVLRQHDLAVVVDTHGDIRKVAVGLRWSMEAELAVGSERGMRHRSAQRYSFDQRAATVVVVSEDGPVTVYRSGRIVVTTA